MSSAAYGPLKRKADILSPSTAADTKKSKADASITSFFSAPRATSTSLKPAATSSSFSSASPATPKFDKEKWIAKLSPEQKTLLKLEIDTLEESWLAHLKDEILSSGFLELKRFLKSEIDSGKKLFPPMEEVYSWSRHTPLSTVRVVIIGQDPYHNHNQAHGLCFSVRPPTPAPPSLKNMYLALANDYPSFTPPPRNSGLLTPWAEQGVLMLNTCLTVRAHEAASHKNKGWERFTQKVIDTVAKSRTRGVVFLAWGSPAQQRCKGLGTSGKHLVLQSVHPSPLSAHKGFLTCGHFKKTNDWLKGRYGDDGIIDWNLDKPKAIAAPKTDGPVKLTADQEIDAQEAGPTTGLVEEGQEAGPAPTMIKVAQVEMNAEDEDADAIEALEEIAHADGEAQSNDKESDEPET